MHQVKPSTPGITAIEVCYYAYTTSNALQRERDALRQEQRLMASAYHKLSERLYREISWQHVVPPTPDDEDSATGYEAPRITNKSSSWIAQQRNALSEAFGLISK